MSELGNKADYDTMEPCDYKYNVKWNLFNTTHLQMLCPQKTNGQWLTMSIIKKKNTDRVKQHDCKSQMHLILK